MIRGPLAASAIAAAVLFFLAVPAVSAPAGALLAALALLSWAVFASGRLVLRAAGAIDLPLAAAWPAGVAALGVATLATVAIAPLTAFAALVPWAILGILGDVLLARRIPPEPPPGRTDLVAIVLCALLAAAWCRELAGAPRALELQGRLPAWIDFFIHGGVISQFGDPRAIGRGAIWLADYPRPVYHYASYMLPAALAVPLDLPGLPLATSLWVPIGFFALASGGYALGAALAGPAGGVAALAALLVAPDASNYWLRNGFYSFHWNMLSHPGSTYALGTALLAVVLLQRWIETRARAALAASLALVAATFVFRVHVFLLLLPAWLAVLALASRTVARHPKRFLLAGAALAIAALAGLRALPELPLGESWAFDQGQALERFLHQVHDRQEPTGYEGAYRRAREAYGDAIGLAAGVLLVYPAALGAFLVLLPAAMWLVRKRLRLRGIDAFPLALIAFYGLIMVLAPVPSHQDSTDLTHRPFVLLYAAIAVWTAAAFMDWLSRQGEHGPGRLWQTAALACALALPVLWVLAAELARPKFGWGWELARHAIAPDLRAGAAFLRTRSRAGDTFAASGLAPGYAPIDAPTALVALTATPAFLARPWYQVFLGGPRAALAIRRYNALKAAEHASTPSAAMSELRKLGVRWYVVTKPGEPSWDPARSRAAFNRGTVAIYDTISP